MLPPSVFSTANTLMSYVRCLRGIGSGAEYPPDAIMHLCPEDQRPVEMVVDLDRLQDDYPGTSWYAPDRPDMWRFGPLLPLDPNDAADRRHLVTLGEGYTPLLNYDDHPLARRAGFRLDVKDEGAGHEGYGQNPTQSFKDRGMAVVASMARRLGLSRLAVPTQGNAGDALTEYGVAGDLEVAIGMPDDTPLPILGKVAAYEKLHDNVHLEVVSGTIQEASELIRDKYLSDDYFNVATFREPGWRIEGKKTMGLELAEPRTGRDHWQAPDVVIYPTGGGTGILGMWKAFDELETLGLIDRRPRMVSVQSAETAPLVEAFERGDEDVVPVDPGATIATGLNVAQGIGHFRVLEVLRASDGCALAVPEEAIARSLQDTFRSKGWWICPEGAACLAALEPLAERGIIREGDHVVAFNTASLEKYLPNVRRLIQ